MEASFVSKVSSESSWFPYEESELECLLYRGRIHGYTNTNKENKRNPARLLDGDLSRSSRPYLGRLCTDKDESKASFIWKPNHRPTRGHLCQRPLFDASPGSARSSLSVHVINLFPAVSVRVTRAGTRVIVSRADAQATVLKVPVVEKIHRSQGCH